MTENVNNNSIILASSIATGLVLLLVFMILIVVIITTFTVVRQKQHRGNVFLHCKHSYQFNAAGGAASGVIDHVPVDDNPAYITMKRITLNKNTAYETVNINETINTSAVYETVL